MSHEIARRRDGTYMMASTEKEWHSGETRHAILARDADPEEWAKESGLDFVILKSKIRFATERDQDPSEWSEYPGQVVLLRSDTRKQFAIVGENFKIVQPRAKIDMYRDKLRKLGFYMESAGVLFDGARMWITASADRSALIVPHDTVKAYLNVATANDGSMKTTGWHSNTRVVCNNTLQMALSEKGAKVKQSHKSTFDPDTMLRELGLAGDTFETFVKNARAMAEVEVKPAQAEDMTLTLLMPDEAPTLADEIDRVRNSLAFKRITSLFNGEGKGSKLEGVHETCWGWLNSVSEYSDHHVRATSAENRMASSWFGAGSALKAKALEMATSMVE